MGLDPSDILFLAIVIWLVVLIINNDDSGGGWRSRVYEQ